MSSCYTLYLVGGVKKYAEERATAHGLKFSDLCKGPGGKGNCDLFSSSGAVCSNCNAILQGFGKNDTITLNPIPESLKQSLK